MAAVALASTLFLSLLTGIADAQAVLGPAATYFPLTPTRLLDTRTGTGAPAAKLGPGASLDLTVVGVGGVPASGVAAVVLNVTATDVSGPDSFLTVFPADRARPLASNLNVKAGRTSTNLVKVAVPTTGDKAGKVTIYNNLGSVSVVADVNGWYSVPGGSAGGKFSAVTGPLPRVLDTRIGQGAPRSTVAAGQTIDVEVAKEAVGVPPPYLASAVVLNVTAIHSGGPESYLTVFPTGTARPLASNLNFLNGQVVPNLVVAPISPEGKVSIYNNLGQVHIVADVQGWYTKPGEFSQRSTYVPLSPGRHLDTRTGVGTGGRIARLGPGETLELVVNNANGVPLTGVESVVFNVTAIDHTGADSFLTVYPTGSIRPLASNLNFVSGETIPNLVVVQAGANYHISIYNNAGAVHVAADVQGYFRPDGA